MGEKINKLDYFTVIIVITIIILFFSGSIYLFYKEVTAERYEKIITGIVMEVKEGEAVNASGYAISEVIGVAMAEQASVTVKTSEEIIEVKTNDRVINNNNLGKKAIIKERGKIKNGKRIRDELILISIE